MDHVWIMFVEQHERYPLANGWFALNEFQTLARRAPKLFCTRTSGSVLVQLLSRPRFGHHSTGYHFDGHSPLDEKQLPSCFSFHQTEIKHS